jgi:hypothetical protein
MTARSPTRWTFRSTGRATTFVAAQLEAEYRVAAMWVLFVRHEALGARARDPYLDRFIDFPKARTLGGARFDLTAHQALTLELASHKRRDGTGYLQMALQWSAALP